ncbi:MAG: hypothetical protein QT10_C0007G0088 [archaeon GW2011_AR19]|nr:MAG: hypothetical protein QT10_C0007G0088 [archaeon GW2011_AR19]
MKPTKLQTKKLYLMMLIVVVIAPTFYILNSLGHTFTGSYLIPPLAWGVFLIIVIYKGIKTGELKKEFEK